jgi:hypothetical protein
MASNNIRVLIQSLALATLFVDALASSSPLAEPSLQKAVLTTTTTTETVTKNELKFDSKSGMWSKKRTKNEEEQGLATPGSGGLKAYDSYHSDMDGFDMDDPHTGKDQLSSEPVGKNPFSAEDVAEGEVQSFDFDANTRYSYHGQDLSLAPLIKMIRELQAQYSLSSSTRDSRIKDHLVQLEQEFSKVYARVKSLAHEVTEIKQEESLWKCSAAADSLCLKSGRYKPLCKALPRTGPDEPTDAELEMLDGFGSKASPRTGPDQLTDAELQVFDGHAASYRTRTKIY